jgi:hypothetical protein
MNKKSIAGHFLIVALVVIGLVFLSRASVESARNQPVVSTGQIKVIFPNGGEQFVQGAVNTITWLGGNRIVAVALVKPEATITVDPDSSGMILGWINNPLEERFFPVEGSATWNGLKVCDLAINSSSTCRTISPGNYKILTLSENADGSMYIGSGTGATFKYTKRDFHGNWDLSDQQFTIVAK